MIQHIKTSKLDLKIIFVELTNPATKPTFNEVVKRNQRTLYVGLAHGQFIYSVKTGSGLEEYIRLDFTDKLTFYERPYNSYFFRWATCFNDPNSKKMKSFQEATKEIRGTGSFSPKALTYQILKPPVPSKFTGKSLLSYRDVTVDLTDDVFFKIEQYEQSLITKKKRPGVHIRSIITAADVKGFGDKNKDGIVDVYQYKSFGDINNDGIADKYQTIKFYKYKNMFNFTDMNRDGICDNYIGLVFRGKYAIYPKITVDISEDFFINKRNYIKRYKKVELELDWLETPLEPSDHRIYFTDANNDGIGDRFQNTKLFFYTYKDHKFTDNNNDTIHDGFQTVNFYYMAGLTNFIDKDGDKLCDNYLR